MKNLLAVLLFATSLGFSQTSTLYPNFDFELGNLNNWTFYTTNRSSISHSLTGTPVSCTPTTSTTYACSNTAYITDTVFTKTVTSCSISTTFPNPKGRYLLFLRGGASSAYATVASYQFTVNALAPILNLNYVMELTSSESGLAQSFTQIQIKDISNAVIPGSFADFSILTHSSVATYYNFATYCYGWNTYIQNLSAYIGQTLTIELIASSCAYTGHNNLNYFDGYFTTITGIRETELQKSIQVIPNPANDFITIKKPFKEDLRVIIYDAQGRVMKEENSERIDISDLQKGLYFIRAIGKQNNYSQTFVKE